MSICTDSYPLINHFDESQNVHISSVFNNKPKQYFDIKTKKIFGQKHEKQKHKSASAASDRQAWIT